MNSSPQKTISFSPPDITEAEIEAVADALRSGWITTGPKTKQLERELAVLTGSDGFACLASATAALECALRALGIGSGDEVITSAYTYTASASVICHVGATPVLCDTAPGSYEMDYAALGDLITERTKAVIPIDIAGRMCDYDRLFGVLSTKRDLWRPANEIQKCFDRVIVVADGAHSLGASYHDRPSGSVADFTAFSFHAVKNFTTAEGGGLAWHIPCDCNDPADALSDLVEPATGEPLFASSELYRHIMLLSLHGQTKDALAKAQASAWEYDIAFPGWKCNMTDVQAAMGLVQLERYPELLERRTKIVARYAANLKDAPVELLPHWGSWNMSSCHLMLVRLTGKDESFRNAVIERMAEAGIATNVHYKPLPMFTAYKDLGFDIADFPNAYAQYENEITLPLHTLLTNDDVDYISDTLKGILDEADTAAPEAEYVFNSVSVANETQSDEPADRIVVTVESVPGFPDARSGTEGI